MPCKCPRVGTSSDSLFKRSACPSCRFCNPGSCTAMLPGLRGPWPGLGPGLGSGEAAAAGLGQQQACEPGGQQATRLVDQELRLLNTAVPAEAAAGEQLSGGGGGGGALPALLPRANSLPARSRSREPAALGPRYLSLPAGFAQVPDAGCSTDAAAAADPPAAKRRRASRAMPPAAAPQAPTPRPAATQVDDDENEDGESRRQHHRMQRNRNSAAASRCAPPLQVRAMPGSSCGPQPTSNLQPRLPAHPNFAGSGAWTAWPFWRAEWWS